MKVKSNRKLSEWNEKWYCFSNVAVTVQQPDIFFNFRDRVELWKTIAWILYAIANHENYTETRNCQQLIVSYFEEITLFFLVKVVADIFSKNTAASCRFLFNSNKWKSEERKENTQKKIIGFLKENNGTIKQSRNNK